MLRLALALAVALAPTVALALGLGGCATSGRPQPAAPPASPSASALVTVASAHDHATTLTRAVAAIEERGFTLVHRVDHAAAAQTAGLTLEPSTVLVFGNPKGGTPLLQAAPTMALDLPLRVLVWQRDGKAWVSYREPASVAQAHGAAEHPVVPKLRAALEAIAAAATGM